MKFVITGVSSGLGQALARELCSMGHEIAGCARSEDKIQSMSREIPEGYFQVVDITAEESVSNWAQSVLDRMGPPDYLLNNAALINRNAKLWEISEKEFEDIIRVNLGGVHRTIRHFLPAMIRAGRGMLINFSSGWGRSTSPEVAPYCATKWGIEGLSKALAQELPAGLGVVSLNPGIIDTPMLRSAFGEAASSHQDAATWAKKAAAFILELSSGDNGKSLSIA